RLDARQLDQPLADSARRRIYLFRPLAPADCGAVPLLPLSSRNSLTSNVFTSTLLSSVVHFG
ncbi:MAG TPA: hypothetical protein VHH52_09350, partial [Pseudonocardiaceae bacterium]|nr:hypothetical protein [Pseudonocardiaceae bacterium]